eukprot:SAG22_NODE_15217_length_354_cov_0.803922_1_plen_34_part_01
MPPDQNAAAPPPAQHKQPEVPRHSAGERNTGRYL